MAAPYTANDEQVIANGVAQAMGKTGAPRIYTTGSPSPQIPISAIYCVQDCVFFELSIYVNENSSTYNAQENQEIAVDSSGESGNIATVEFIPAGTIFRGNIYSFTLDTGLLIAYPA